MAFTMKLNVTTKEQFDEEQQLVFTAAYADKHGTPINQNWARFTPVATLSTRVKNSVVEENGIEKGKTYLVTFEEVES